MTTDCNQILKTGAHGGLYAGTGLFAAAVVGSVGLGAGAVIGVAYWGIKYAVHKVVETVFVTMKDGIIKKMIVIAIEFLVTATLVWVALLAFKGSLAFPAVLLLTGVLAAAALAIEKIASEIHKRM